MRDWRNGRAVLDAYPKVKEQSIMIDELRDMIDVYRKLLEQLDIEFPQKTSSCRTCSTKKNRSPAALTKQGATAAALSM